MRWLTGLILILATNLSVAADYARETKWADEILPNVVVGDPIYLEQKNGHKVLGLYTAVPDAKATVIVLHGLGVHPDWELIGVLRQQLPDKGYSTLSIQMPILGVDAKAEEYPATFPEAGERIALALAFAKNKGAKKIALVSHSMGTGMVLDFIRTHPRAPVAAWVAIGLGADDYKGLTLPILDLYGEKDFPATLGGAKKRADSLKGNPKSAQIMAPGADHFFTGRDADLVRYVADYLDKTLN